MKQHIAQAHRARGDLQRAREFYLAELRDDPGNTDLLVEMGELAVEAGEFPAAITRFQQVLELEPDHSEAASALADALLRTGDAQAALDVLLGLTETEPGTPFLDERLGEAYLALAQYEQARKHLEAAVASDPRDKNALLSLGTCLLHLGRHHVAEDIFTRMLALDADSPCTHHNLAVCCFLSGDYERGLGHCLRAIELKPDYRMAVSKAAVAYVELGRWTEARAMIARGLELDPDDHALQQLNQTLWRYRCRHVLLRIVRLPQAWFRH